MRIALLTCLIAALGASPALAKGKDPLLSGYGGPGSGEQVLLGSSLLGGAGSGGGHGGTRGGGHGGGAASLVAPGTTIAGTPSSGTAATTANGGAAPRNARGARATRGRHNGRVPPGGGASTPATGARPGAARQATPTSSGGSSPLNGRDLAVALLAAAFLACVAMVTARYVRDNSAKARLRRAVGTAGPERLGEAPPTRLRPR